MNLHEAAKNGDINRINELLDQGVDINLKDIYGRTALMFASGYSNSTSSLETVKLLLDRKADLNLKDKNGRTALIFASINSNSKSSLETVKLLLDREADVNLKEENGWSALLVASVYSNTTSSLETVKLLLDKGADVDLKDKNDNTALFFTVRYSNTTSSLETVKLLLDRGADLFIVDNVNKSAIDYCPTQECKKLINEYIWKRLYSRDKDIARRYSKTTRLPKDVWEIILLNKRQQQLCQNLSSDKNKEVLQFFAMEFGIPVEGLSKAKLCGMIARQLAYGKVIQNKTEEEFREMEKSIRIFAKKLGIDTNRPIDKISADISKILL